MSRLKKILLLVLTASLLVGTSFVQKSLNRDREQLGLTRVEPLENAPPVLAFTTVALGGFRGLISNMLWIRANDLQEEDKFFEMTQLADWITKLEPHFAQVWVHQAWNMAYNISVKFKQSAPGEYPDRWRWVNRGIELLRDEGLVYNPNAVLIYRELAWFFQHKLGANLDDANMYYKEQWLKEMNTVLGPPDGKTDFAALIHPQTDEQKKRAQVLKEKFKMDPVLMQELDEKYGPFEWHLPEASAIYWAAEGLKHAEANPTRVTEDLLQLRRVIYQSMLLSFQRGRLITNALTGGLDLGPNLDIIPNVNKAYEDNMGEDEKDRPNISTGHRNFLRQAVYSLYVNNRVAEAAKLFKYLGEKYPDKPILDDDTNSFPRNVTLEQYALSNLQIDINETSRDRVKTAIEGLLIQSYSNLIMGESARAESFRRLANKVWDSYRAKIGNSGWDRVGLPPVSEIARTVVDRLLDPQSGLPPEARAVLRTELQLPAETGPAPAPAATTNALNSAAPPK